VIVRFVDVGRLVDHHCLEVIVRFVDIGATSLPISTKRTITSKQ
jgi:hypothetical protein